jgi:hypothetical protein
VAADDGRPGWGLHIGQVSWRPPAPERTTATVRIELWPKCRPGHGRGPVPPDFRGQPLVVSIGDDFITTDFDPPMMSTRTVEDLDADCQPKPTIAEVGTATIQVEVPTAILDGERLVRVRVPFASRDFDDRRVIYPSFRIDRVVRVSDSPTVLDIVGAGFVKDAITVHADRPYRTEAVER